MLVATVYLNFSRSSGALTECIRDSPLYTLESVLRRNDAGDRVTRTSNKPVPNVFRTTTMGHIHYTEEIIFIYIIKLCI